METAVITKSGLRQAGEILTLIGAILETVGNALLIIGTFFMWSIPGAAIISLLWVSRNQVIKNNSKGWMIYGVVHGALFGTLTMIGNMLMLIDANREAEVSTKVGMLVGFILALLPVGWLTTSFIFAFMTT